MSCASGSSSFLFLHSRTTLECITVQAQAPSQTIVAGCLFPVTEATSKVVLQDTTFGTKARETGSRGAMTAASLSGSSRDLIHALTERGCSAKASREQFGYACCFLTLRWPGFLCIFKPVFCFCLLGAADSIPLEYSERRISAILSLLLIFLTGLGNRRCLSAVVLLLSPMNTSCAGGLINHSTLCWGAL